jgi:NADH-quinone oxidoreductase E subunit
MLSEDATHKLDHLRGTYPNVRSVLLPALYVAQEDQGALTPEVIREVAEYFSLSPGEVESVATFYTMYRERKLGKYLLQVCTNISCGLMGSAHILDRLSEKLGIKVGETTPDGKFTLLTVECLGACGSAPVMQVNEEFYENMTPEKIDTLLEELV